STPRLSTPDRSTTSSPMAAISSGVAAVAIVRMTASNIGCLPCGSHLRTDEADLVVDQGVAGEHEEQDHALEGTHHLVRKADGNLRRLAAKIGERQHEAGRHDAQRIEPSEKRDDDRGEAIADGQFFIEVPDGTGDLGYAGEPGKRARYEEGED